jgi:hypothetical protein
LQHAELRAWVRERSVEAFQHWRLDRCIAKLTMPAL